MGIAVCAEAENRQGACLDSACSADCSQDAGNMVDAMGLNSEFLSSGFSKIESVFSSSSGASK